MYEQPVWIIAPWELLFTNWQDWKLIPIEFEMLIPESRLLNQHPMNLMFLAATTDAAEDELSKKQLTKKLKAAVRMFVALEPLIDKG